MGSRFRCEDDKSGKWRLCVPLQARKRRKNRGDAALRIDPLEIAQQQKTEVDPR